MKFLVSILLTAFLTAFGFNLYAQDSKIYEPKPIVDIRGDETPDHSNIEIIETTTSPRFDPVYTSEFTFNVHNITDRKTGYDLQSNASTQQVWLDYGNPNFLHAIFTNSQVATTWADRTCLYFGSTDAGVTWFEFGGVPVNTGSDGRSGFPSVYGLVGGEAIILDHNNSSGTITHTKVYADNSPFEYNFTEYDPNNISDGPVWPRHTVTANGIVIFASSGSPAPDDDVKINTLDLSTGLFSGWQDLESDDAEQYDFSISPNGKIGLAYNGWDGATPDESGDVFYIESTDKGLTWSDPPIKVFDRDETQDTAMGSIRGVAVNFYNEEPCVTYEICQQIFSGGNFFPGLPSEIHFWSPNVNGGLPQVIADSSNVPYYPYVGTNDVHVPVCRPAIGRADNGYLFIAFNATTEHLFPSPDTTSYMAGFFTYSSDGGENWAVPEKFTPDSPLLDWRYPSIAEVIPVTVTDGEVFTVHIVMQGDSLPGSTVNAAGMPTGVTAQYYHFSADVTIGSTGSSAGTITSYQLAQNYPNPFNPSTNIKYTIPSESFVQLKIFDVLGNEVATLVNEDKPAGIYDVEFTNADNPSGVYFYTLTAGDFSQTKKMLLLK
ncbi:MAG: T9SS type A sorting domain-containing protein [Ignavibacteria bacterium]|nr:T9SS type A sorting domain-containing protein [Ignavibacteria bacterium]